MTGMPATDDAAAGQMQEQRGADPETRRRLAPAERTPQILEAALEEFAERGYAGARMAAVAARAGIAKGLIYHYFPSKAALLQATVRACTQPAFEELEQAERRVAGMSGSARDLLAALIEVAYARVRKEGRERHLLRLIVTEAEHFPELARFYREEVLSRATAVVRAVLRAGVASGEFAPEAVETPGLAEVIMAPAMMASVWRMILGEADAPALERMQAAHLDLLLKGLAASCKP